MGKKSKDPLTSNAGKACKWCLTGQCWTHGQIARDPSYVPPTPTVTPGVKKNILKNAAAKPAAGKKQPANAMNQLASNPQMMQMFAQLVQGGGNQQAAGQLMQLLGQVQGAGGAGAQGDNSKELLHKWIAEVTGAVPTKDAVVYSTSEVPESKPTQFVSTMVILVIDPSRTYTGEPGASKKQAEVNAARQALQENGRATGQAPGGGGGGGGGKNKKKKKKNNAAAALLAA